MTNIDGHLSITGGSQTPQGGTVVCPSLPRCVVFVPDSDTAEAVTGGGLDRDVQSAVGEDQALVWVSSPAAPIVALRFDSAGRVTQDATFTLTPFDLRIPAGSRVEGGAGEAPYVVLGGESQLTFGQSPVDGQRVEVGNSSTSEAGLIRFSAALSGAEVGPSLRYFYSPAEGQVAGFDYPIFLSGLSVAESAARLPVEASIHPSHPADAGLNRLTLNSSEGGQTNFRSVDGVALSLSTIPGQSGIGQQWDPVQQLLYPTPIGEWKLGLGSGATGASGPTGGINMMCGLSGLEYAKVDEGSVVRFVSNSPSYAPYFLSQGATGGSLSLTGQCPGSTLPVTTSWVYVAADGPTGMAGGPVGLSAATGPVGPQGYFSQPEHGGLFQTVPGDPFLQVLQLQTASFPPDAAPVFGAPQASFPMVPYAGVAAATAGDVSLYTQFEVEVLSTTRSNAIFALNWPEETGPNAGPMLSALPCGGGTGPTGASGPLAVTPQGMLSTFSPDYTVWESLILVTTGYGVSLELRCLCRQMWAALLTNQLFLVVSNPKALQDCCTVLFPNLEISGWQFDLDPTNPPGWREDTVLILKFAQKSFKDLANDLSLWSAPGSSFNNGAATQNIIQQSIQEALDNSDQPEFQYFINTVLENWNGILFLNVNVPPSDFPEQLRGLAAGINISSFKAHHLGVNLSPVRVEDGTIRVTDSSLFALIYYEDPDDLAYQGNPYDFKVLSLRVLFANSDISSFSSQIELLVAQLFGEQSNLTNSGHGDNLILNGVMQKYGDEESYSFTEQGQDVFEMTSQVLDSVVITQAQYITLPQDAQSDLISSRFLLWGSLKFQSLPELDLFSFGPKGATGATGPSGGLQFSNLMVSLAYGSPGPTGPTGPSGPSGPTGPVEPQEKSFAFEAGQMVFDASASVARPQSLYSRFPLQVVGMVQGGAKKMPPDLGYIVMDSPLKTGALGDLWFGLQMFLSLGSQGSLAARAGFAATVLAAWAPSTQGYNTAVAIKLPGSEGGGKTLTIEGPLKLSIGDLALLYTNDDDNGQYLIRFSNIALSVFSLKFPPGGRTNLLLFGDPNPKGANTTLGWYAAYMKNPSKTGPTAPSGTLSLSTNAALGAAPENEE